MTLSRNLAQVIVDNEVSANRIEETLRSYNLLSLLPAVLEEIKRLLARRSEDDVLAIESPFTVSDESIARIKRIVGNDLAEHTVTINPNLLAGWKARFKGIVYDGSAERIIKHLTAN